MMGMKLIKENIKGVDILKYILRGHVMRRNGWLKNHYIRICNEDGFDKDGNIITNDNTTLYSHCTNGYFMHLGFSCEPIDESIFKHGDELHVKREGEGLNHFLNNDWEDYGFIDSEKFEKLTKKLRYVIEKAEKIRLKKKGVI